MSWFNKKSYKLDNLHFHRQYSCSDPYSKRIKFKKENITEILNFFRKEISQSGGISIESKFNNVNYAVFDLDELDNLKLFRRLYTAVPYALFKTSSNHYWGIVDQPFDDIKSIFFEPNWKVCNDQNYINFSREYNKLFIRGIYEDESRKPIIYHINGIFSKNFQLFINKLCIYYNKEGLELSVLRYKDPGMLIKFNRKRKLRQLEEYNSKD